jgi:hypothetical protein
VTAVQLRQTASVCMTEGEQHSSVIWGFYTWWCSCNTAINCLNYFQIALGTLAVVLLKCWFSFFAKNSTFHKSVVGYDEKKILQIYCLNTEKYTPSAN